MTLSNQTLVAILCSFLCTLILTRGIHFLAIRHQLLDTPNHRSSHTVPVPRIGGLAIIAGTMLGSAIALSRLDWSIGAVALGGLLLAVTGMRDDLRPLGAWEKYTPQLIAAGLAAVVLDPSLYIAFPYVDVYVRGLPAVILAILWITAVTNAFNFMDGIDGIAAGVALVTAIVLAFVLGGTSMVILVPLAAALLGFLVWNVEPAAIFMGDVGSQFIGYLLGVAMLMGTQEYAPTIPVIIVFVPFLFDTGFTIIRRLLAHENIFAAHRSHLYQRLTINGVSHRTVANLYYAATAFSGLLAIAYASATAVLQLAVVAGGALLLAEYAAIVMRLDRRSAVAEDVTRSATFSMSHKQGLPSQ